MLDTASEVVTVIVSGSAIMLVLVFFIVSFLFAYQKRQHQHQKEKQQLKTDYERAIQESQIEIQEETLKYVGRELHDNIGQILSLVKLNLHNADNQQQIAFAKDLVGNAIADVRSLSKTLNTDWADDIPLPDLIQQELDKISRGGAFKTEFWCEDFFCHLAAKNKIIVFRVFQECLNNILKHAQASEITVNIHLLLPENTCILEISDNGVGFDTAQASQGSGFYNIHKRMQVIQGRVELTSRIGKGTRVELAFPCASADSAAT